MEVKCANPDCNNLIKKKGRRIYCCKKCNDHCFYLRNKKRYIENARRWDEENPKKRKSIQKKAMDKYTKTEKFRNSILKNYRNNKDKWASRKRTRELVKSGRIILKNKCKHKENLEIHHEIYPTLTKDIINAVNNNKIYYLCRKCHKEGKQTYKKDIGIK